VAVRNDVILQPASGPAINLSEASGLIHVAGREIPVKNNTLFLNTGTTLPEGVNTISVPHGQRFDVALSDGSVVTLNAVTSMKFPFNFNGHTREITLDGEAYVKVARQTGKPFQVHLPNSTVEVLGTSFNINSYDSGLVKVSLIEGKVRMKAGKKTILMKPGQQAVFDQKTESLDTRPFNATVELGWQKGLYCFSEMPIEEVCGTIFRWFGVRAVVDNPAAGQRRFTGLLDKNTPMSFLLDGIKATTGTDFYFTADSTLHFK
jgi:ferric-dicitrate binding protein FerR (iron transport regulator)